MHQAPLCFKLEVHWLTRILLLRESCLLLLVTSVMRFS